MINVISDFSIMGNQQSGSGGGPGKDKGDKTEKKKYEPPVPTRQICIHSLMGVFINKSVYCEKIVQNIRYISRIVNF